MASVYLGIRSIRITAIVGEVLQSVEYSNPYISFGITMKTLETLEVEVPC